MPELRGDSDSGWAVYGRSTNSYGVVGRSTNATGVLGQTGSSDPAVWGSNWGNGTAVYGRSTSGRGVVGGGTIGVDAYGSSYGVYARNTADPSGLAGYFNGSVVVNSHLAVYGNKIFKIDHPLDPENRYLLHNAVESSERKNVYDGVARLDEDGAAWVDLPEWFEALNGDFRYQLTAVGGAAPNLHVSEEISENRFKIAGGEGGMKVCWQITGSRKDPWAAANPFEAEEEKSPEDRGRFLHPDLYNAPEEQRVRIVPMVEPMEEERLRQTIRQEAPPAPEMPPGFATPGFGEPPQPSQIPSGAPAMPPGVAAPSFGRMEEEHRRQIDELRGQIEELRRVSLEDEIDELRRQIKKLRRRR
jgi:hypothetical protein